MARIVASTILKGQLPAKKRIQKKIFRTMKLKMTGIHTVNCLQYGTPVGQPKPNPVRVKLMKKFFGKMNLTEKQLNKWAGLLAFELAWWRDRNWLDSKTLKQLMDKPIPENFNVNSRLLNNR